MSGDIVIVGGGIAGLSLAAELATRGGTGTGIWLLEMERDVALHSSARSAQQLIPSYGPEPVLELTRHTIPGLMRPTPRSSVTLAWPSPFITAGSPEDVAAVTVAGLRSMSQEELFDVCPELAAQPTRYTCGAVDESAVRTNAMELVAWNRVRARSAGVRIVTGARVTSCQPTTCNRWLVSAGDLSVEASVVVNAAGAWADQVAGLVGARSQRLQPRRRTAAYVRLGEPLGPEHPMVEDAKGGWYYRAEADGALISWGEAQPSGPCDPQPRPGAIDHLIAILEEHTFMRITGVRRAWTGLRTESPSDVPVCGWDPVVDNFLWLAGQGGYGFQTCSALARAAADLVMEGQVGDWLSQATRRAITPAP